MFLYAFADFAKCGRIKILSLFQSIPGWVEECEKNNLYNDIPRILVGNKCDCTENYAVNTNIAQRLADKYDMPVSTDNSGIADLFKCRSSLFIS